MPPEQRHCFVSERDPLRLLRVAFLLRIAEEDRGPILRPLVAELLVAHDRIDVVPEPVEQLAAGNFLRVIESFSKIPPAYTLLRRGVMAEDEEVL